MKKSLNDMQTMEIETMSTSTRVGSKENDDDDGTILQFLDSMDSYLTLYESLSSTLRQGWLDLASARHSMGSLRISTAAFDLKEHPASSVVQVTESTNETLEPGPQFTIRKWGSCEKRRDPSREEVDALKTHKQPSSTIIHRGFVGAQETSNEKKGNPVSVDDHVQKERFKALTVFGALVSPKLRSSQASFEEALETLIDIANARSRMLSAFNQLEQKKEGSN